jgi:hypothetical protein
VKDYRDITARLTSVFGPGRALDTIGLDAARDYVRRRLTGTIVYNGRQVQTSGARVLKELKFSRTSCTGGRHRSPVVDEETLRG